jgi:hypothetical protein
MGSYVFQYLYSFVCLILFCTTWILSARKQPFLNGLKLNTAFCKLLCVEHFDGLLV